MKTFFTFFTASWLVPDDELNVATNCHLADLRLNRQQMRTGWEFVERNPALKRRGGWRLLR